MTIATLAGHCVPALMPGFGWADHTYVTSSDGRRWGCWGRDSGGKLLVSGTGDADLADCISQVQSKAGIRYSLTGVCHQTSNRILDPANVTVSGARGYGRSRVLYGTYGLRLIGLSGAVHWPEKKSGCLAGVAAADAKAASDGESVSPDLKKFYAELLRSSDTPVQLSRQIIIAEALDMVTSTELKMGKISPATFIIEKHVELFDERLPLIGLFLRRRLTGQMFAEIVNDRLQTKLERIGKMIGRELFSRIYGTLPEERIDVVEPTSVESVAIRVKTLRKYRRTYSRRGSDIVGLAAG